MDYYQGVVQEYLTADRRIFISPEYLIDLDEGRGSQKGRSWFVDILAIDFSDSTVTLCEVTLSKTPSALLTRLRGWSNAWLEVQHCSASTSRLPTGMTFAVRVFTPGHDGRVDKLRRRLEATQLAFQPSITQTSRRLRLGGTRPTSATYDALNTLALAVRAALKRLRRQVVDVDGTGVLIHSAEEAGGRLSIRDADTDWPAKTQAFQVLYALKAAA